MIDEKRVREFNQSIKEFAEQGLSQEKARIKMGLQYGLSDSFQLRTWIATGYYMYEKERREKADDKIRR